MPDGRQVGLAGLMPQRTLERNGVVEWWELLGRSRIRGFESRTHQRRFARLSVPDRNEMKMKGDRHDSPRWN